MRTFIILLFSTTLALSGCSFVNDAPRLPEDGRVPVSNTVKGGIAGGVVGGAAGSLARGKHSTGIGALAGVVVGGIIGHHFDNQQKQVDHQLHAADVQLVKHGNDLELILPSNVNFAANSAAVKTKYQEMLVAVADILNQHPGHYLTINGYTDNHGNPEANQFLSEERAYNVASFLEDHGVMPSRLHVTGRGDRHPLANNMTKRGRAENRRVEMKLHSG